MNLNKMFVFIFVFFIVFSAFLVNMPGEFLGLGVDADVQDKEVAAFFNAANVTMYNYTLSIDLIFDTPYENQSGLPSGQALRFSFGYETHFTRDMFEIHHLTSNFAGWWWDWHYLVMPEVYWRQTTLGSGIGIDRNGLLELFDETANATYAEFVCEHISLKVFILTANQSWTLQESWDNGKVKIFTSYDIDWSKTGTSMWHVMGQLLTFQNPELGIPGLGGDILTAGFGGALWACIAILFYAIITAVLPFVSGWGGG